MRHRPEQEADLLFYKASKLEEENKRLRAALIEAARHLDNAADAARAYDDDDWYMQAASAAATARASVDTPSPAHRGQQ